MKLRSIILMLLMLFVLVESCKKQEAENPYDELVHVVEIDNPDVNELPVGNFAWLHGKVFKPTCANSGCHDGTFEPKFNTISSSYNSLVNQPVISNDAGFTFQYRVKPGDVDASLLHERLTNSIPNSSGIMPLEVDEGSDWDGQALSYIAQIETWIESGAPDMFGNVAGEASSDFPPQVDGLAVFPAGNTTDPYIREPEGQGITPILVDNGMVDMWVRVSDDQTPVSEIAVNELKLAENIAEFDLSASQLFSTTETLLATDLNGSPATFNRKVTVDLSSYPIGTTLFIRTYFDDGVQTTVTEIPNENSNAIITAIFVIQVQ